MIHIKATDKTLVVKQVELETKANNNNALIVPTSKQYQSEVSFAEVIDSKSEQYPNGTIVIFRSGFGFPITIKKVEYIILNVEQVIGTIFDDKPSIKRKLPLVSNDTTFLHDAEYRWSKLGIYNKDTMEIDPTTMYVLLENEIKYIEEHEQSNNTKREEFLNFIFPMISRVYSNNTLIQATNKPAFHFENEEKTHDNLKVVTSIHLKTKMNMTYTRSDNSYFDKVVESLTKEIDELGECVVYTPLVANKIMLQDSFDDEFRFIIRLWKPKVNS